MNKLIILFLPVLLYSNKDTLRAQGCSDAGFCSLSSLKPTGPDSMDVSNRAMRISSSYGKADHQIDIISYYIEYNQKLNANWQADIRLTSLSQRGNNISETGLSDIFLNVSRKSGDHWKAIAGFKIPLNRSEKSNPLYQSELPLDYQSSLGTFDLIAGVLYQYKKFQMHAGLQLPLIQNKNNFNPGLFPTGSPLRDFQNTNEFLRSPDLLLRLNYPVQLHKSVTLTAGLLPVYHLFNDRFTDTSGQRREIEGSNGLTLNFNAFLDVSLSKGTKLQVNFGMPFITRKSRPDGLTRHYIGGLELSFRL